MQDRHNIPRADTTPDSIKLTQGNKIDCKRELQTVTVADAKLHFAKKANDSHTHLQVTKLSGLPLAVQRWTTQERWQHWTERDRYFRTVGEFVELHNITYPATSHFKDFTSFVSSWHPPNATSVPILKLARPYGAITGSRQWKLELPCSSSSTCSGQEGAVSEPWETHPSMDIPDRDYKRRRGGKKRQRRGRKGRKENKGRQISI